MTKQQGLGTVISVSNRRVSGLVLACLGTLLATCLSNSPVVGQAPRVQPEGQLPPDSRLEPLKDLDGYFPFQPPESRQAWQVRRERVQRQLLVANGLWPLPEKTPLNAVIHGKVDRGDYTVERVYFESMPGFFVTGSLYRPAQADGKRAGILCPHGHWADGRFYDCGEAEVKRMIEIGAESFAEGGRSPLQSRCVQLARMGAVVFHYDMIGYADSRQLSFDLAHRFANQRPGMNKSDAWGLFSPRAESHLQSIMGLQTYNSMRALDFLESLADVDAERLAVTGASGGGTQTFMLAALDPRVKTAFPAVMVSTAMQGGCTCENCSLLRVGTGNVEIAGLFAPKPMGMTAANDWTKEMETKGFPQLQQLYRLLGAPDAVHLTSRTEFDHNYNQVGRAAMYRVFQPALQLEPSFDEADFQRLSTEEMTVWNDDHPLPPGGEEFERKLLQWWRDSTHTQLKQIVPSDEKGLAEYRRVVGGGLDVVIGRAFPASGETEWDLKDKQDRGDYLEMTGWVKNLPQNEALPVVFVYPKVWNGKVVIWFDGAGKNGLYDAAGKPTAAVKKLVAAGVAVVGADLFYQGEFLVDGKPLEKTRRVANPRESAAYTFGYNASVAAQRAHDVITLVGMIARDDDHEVDEIAVIGTGTAGSIVATAAPVIDPFVDVIAVDTQGFRYGQIEDLHDPRFLPGGARYFDLPGFLSLATTSELLIAGEVEGVPFPVAPCLQAAGRGEAVKAVLQEDLVERLTARVMRP